MGHHESIEDETARQGHDLYEKTIRPLVETEANIGKIVAIDVTSGDYEVDEDLIKATNRLLARKPDAVLWSERIGYDAVYAVA